MSATAVLDAGGFAMFRDWLGSWVDRPCGERWVMQVVMLLSVMVGEWL